MAAKFFTPNPPAENISRTQGGPPALNIVPKAVNIRDLSAIALQNITIDVGPGPINPIIFRGGKEITPPDFNVNKVDDFISHTSVLPRLRLPVTLSQSIPAGTMVAKGTPIDIVLVPASDLTFGLLDQVHQQMINLAITDALPLISDPQVAPLLDKDAADLNADQKQLISQKLASTFDISIDDSNPGTTFALAFNALKSAQAFA
jgi:hypothetical protein